MFKANFNTMSKYILQFWVIFMVASCTICCEFRVCQMHSNIWCCWSMYVEDDSNDNDNDNEVEKTLAIIIGIIAAVALIIVFVSFLNKLCDTGKGTYIYNHSFGLSFQPFVLFSRLTICSLYYIKSQYLIPFCCMLLLLQNANNFTIWG